MKYRTLMMSLRENRFYYVFLHNSTLNFALPSELYNNSLFAFSAILSNIFVHYC